MSGYQNRSGIWSKLTPYGKSGGSWLKAKQGYVKDADTWKQWWLDGGVNDSTFNFLDNSLYFSGVPRDIKLSGNFLFIGGSVQYKKNIYGLIKTNFEGYADTTFNTNLGTGPNLPVNSIAVQSDGKILAGGEFTTFNGSTRNYLVRLNSDGTLDTTFSTNLGTGFNGIVHSIEVQSDGKILVGGEFTTLNGITRNRFVRLNSDGTVDTAFYTNLGTAFNFLIYSIKIQSDSKIVMVGQFSTFNGNTRNRVIRLNSDGTEDTAFYTNLGTGFGSTASRLAIQSDGKILVGGPFTTLNGNTRNYLVRLNSDGTEDTAFYTNLGTGFNDVVKAIFPQSDGKILVGGLFGTLNGSTRFRIVRLNSDGTVDTVFSTNTSSGLSYSVGLSSTTVETIYHDTNSGRTFIGGTFDFFNSNYTGSVVRVLNGSLDTYFSGTGFDSFLSSIEIQSDGKIVAGGFFSNFANKKVSWLTKLNLDGTVDDIFNSSYDTDRITYYPNSIKLQSDEKILVGGGFSGIFFRFNKNGTRDTSFNTNLGSSFNNTVFGITTQSDGKILVGGSFTGFNGNTRNRLVRLNSDGTEDTAFYANLGTGFNNTVNTVAVQSDGKILVGGNFTTFNGNTRNYLVRLNSNGTLDTSFYTNMGTSFGNTVHTIAVQSDGKILTGGNFTTLNGTTRNRLVRLNSDGTEDTAFYTNLGTAFNNIINTIAIQSDGKILVGGDFTSSNGNTRNALVRLNSNGTEDTTFYTNLGTAFSIPFGGPGYISSINSIKIDSNGYIYIAGNFSTFNGKQIKSLVKLNSDGTLFTPYATISGTGFDLVSVQTIKIQSDGKILVGGTYTIFNRNTRNRLVRLNSDGTEDTAFYTNLGIGFNSTVFSIALQSDGKILAAGGFNTLNGTTRNCFVRLNSNGTVDTAFYTNLGTGFLSTQYSIALQSDGKILIGGGGNTFNGNTRNRLVRLNSDGTEDTAFYTNLGTGFDGIVRSITLQSDGKILVGGSFITLNGTTRNRLVRLNSDGTEDTAFYTNLGTGFNSAIYSITVQSDGKILVGGLFNALNGTTRNRLVRLNSDGTVDTTFYTNLGTGFDGSIWSVTVQSNGKILVGGDFISFKGNTRNCLVRLNSDGTEDTAFYTNLGTGFDDIIYSTIVQSDGKILVGGNFTTLNNSIIRSRIAQIGGE